MGAWGGLRRTGAWLALALAVLVGGGCSAGPAPEPASTPTGSAAAPVDAEQTVRDTCLSALPADAEIRAVTLEGATDGSVQAVVFPSSGARVALVLLPQIDGGVCGWGRFARDAAELGVASIVVAPCLYGESTCSAAGDADPLNEVAPAIETVRAELGVDRVALVGASMGGSLAVMAVAAGADVDTWVGVSGPSAWEGTGLLSLVPSLPPGGLVVQARSDGAAEYDRARQLARRSDGTFLDAGSGHGYEVLTDLDGRITRVGRAVLAHAQGWSAPAHSDLVRAGMSAKIVRLLRRVALYTRLAECGSTFDF